MQFADFWYIVALSEQLQPNKVLPRTVLGEWLAIFRGEDGQPVALRDRCLHRNSRLSSGNICNGALQCPYHGWVYDELVMSLLFQPKEMSSNLPHSVEPSVMLPKNRMAMFMCG